MVVTMSRTPLPTATWEWQGLFVSSCAARNYQRTTGSQQGTCAASFTDRNPHAAGLAPNQKLPLLAVGEMYARSHGSTDCKLPPELNMYTARLPAGIEWRESARVRKVPPGPHSSTHSRTGSQAAFPCDKHASNNTGTRMRTLWTVLSVLH